MQPIAEAIADGNRVPVTIPPAEASDSADTSMLNSFAGDTSGVVLIAEADSTPAIGGTPAADAIASSDAALGGLTGEPPENLPLRDFRAQALSAAATVAWQARSRRCRNQEACDY